MKKLGLTLISAIVPVAMMASGQWTLQGNTYTVDTLYHAYVGPSTTQTSLRLSGSSNLEVFYTTTDLTDPNVEMRVIKASDKLAACSTVSKMAKSKSKSGSQYFAGVNADFFGYQKPIGTTVVNDEIYYAANNGWTHWATDADKVPYLGSMTFGGTVAKGESSHSLTAINADRGENYLVIYTPRFGSNSGTNEYGSEVVITPVSGSLAVGKTATMKVVGTPSTAGSMTIPSGSYVLSGHGTGKTFVSSLADGDEITVSATLSLGGTSIEAKQVAGGQPMILSGGVVLNTESALDHLVSLNPRTAVGHDATGTKLVMLVVDGRRAPASAGCVSKVLADIMRETGCTEAMNFDGGGSSAMYVQALGIRNVPSDGSERSVTDALYAVATSPDDNTIAEIRFMDHVMTLPKYGYYTPVIYGYNKYGVLISTDVKGYTLSCPDALGVPTNEGATLFSNGSGCHVLTADYNGIKAQLVVTVGEGEPKFRLDNVLLDSFKDYAVEVTATVNGAEMTIDNSALTWSSDNPEIATVDNVGNIQGIKNGTTIIRGNIADIKDSIIVTVEVPTVRYQALDITADLAAWKITKSGIDSIGISANENKALLIDYVMGSARAPKIRIANSVTAWSRPDSIYINFKPNNANISYLQIGVVAKTGRTTWLKFEPQITNNAANRLAIPTGELIDVTDMGAYPFVLGGLDFYISDEKGAKCQIEISSIEGVYTNIDPDAGSVENLIADIKDDKLLITPNPVNAGETISINTDENAVFTIYSVTGRVAKNGIGNVIDTDGLNSGIYIVNVNSDNVIKSAKLVIK